MELKSRAWDRQGEFFIASTDFVISGDGVISVVDYDNKDTWHEGGPITIEHFTGRKDKNGVEIFDGDIWKRGGFVAVVVFEFSGWGLSKAPSSDCYQYPAFHSNAASGEIIGNIHENPELLEGN
jgi:hypothetical protein